MTLPHTRTAPATLAAVLACVAICLLSTACSADEASGTPADTTGDTAERTDTGNAADDVRQQEEGGEDAADVRAEPYTIELFEDARITSIGGEPNFQNVRTDFSFGEGPFRRVLMQVKLDTTCFPFSEWTQPPEGHNWPADCDAFDRNFEITIDDPVDAGDPPAFEVMRAITPFGGPMEVEIDLTDFANARPGEHSLRVHITTWGDGAGQVSGAQGGWNVTVAIDALPGDPPREVLDVIPLFNGSVGADFAFDPLTIDIPEGVASTRLEYRVTGHGGAEDRAGDCIGPAEEFCRRWHSVFLDGEQKASFQPWRDDCDSLCTLQTEGRLQYCQENPTGAIRSVRAPRANWCPGDLVEPRTWSWDELTEAGEHAFRFQIDDIVPGGSWRVSSHLFLFAE